ncbi:DUF4809 domain-containing protein [Enterococcus pseudoavium]|nr:DUF4809 domain-containing protein [Enterococcus pseudoavium]
MKKVVITSKERLTEGGCNACGFINCTTHTLHFEDRRTATLDELDLPSMVMTIAMKNGWRELVETIGIGEEKISLIKNSQIVSIDEAYKQICYKTTSNCIKKTKKIEDINLLFEECNEILGDIFGIDHYLIKIINE